MFPWGNCCCRWECGLELMAVLQIFLAKMELFFGIFERGRCSGGISKILIARILVMVITKE
jgi:hypothetical protein